MPFSFVTRYLHIWSYVVGLLPLAFIASPHMYGNNTSTPPIHVYACTLHLPLDRIWWRQNTLFLNIPLMYTSIQERKESLRLLVKNISSSCLTWIWSLCVLPQQIWKLNKQRIKQSRAIQTVDVPEITPSSVTKNQATCQKKRAGNYRFIKPVL